MHYFTGLLLASTRDLLWDEGGSILESLKSCGIFRGGTTIEEMWGPRWFGETQIWENRERKDKKEACIMASMIWWLLFSEQAEINVGK